MLEAVPNISAADPTTVAAIRHALETTTNVLDVHTDADHGRSVFTVVADSDQLADGLYAGAETAVAAVDLGSHQGAHPRVGVVDVVPIVPLAGASEVIALATAHTVASRLAEGLELPVFFYGELSPARHKPAFFRRGGLEALAKRLGSGEVVPDAGPDRLHPTAGAALVGVRQPLIAFNVDLEDADLATARIVARSVRESDGGLSGVQALGLEFESSGRVQVSTNIEDWTVTPPHVVVDAIEREARQHGARVLGGELVGLLPAGAALAAAAGPLALDRLDPDQVLELRTLAPIAQPEA